MTRPSVSRFVLFLVLVLATSLTRAEGQSDPLPSWNDGPVKQAIFSFVKQVTDRSSPQYVPPVERISVFDNDGTLWCEYPLYPQHQFALDRVRASAPQHPEWKDQQPYKAIIENDPYAQSVEVLKQHLTIINKLYAGLTTDEYSKVVSDWFATAMHPRFGRPYTELVYQPMLELLAYLRANEFKTWIISGGSQEFMRPWTQRAYGIPPEQVVGSWCRVELQMRGGELVLARLPEVGGLSNIEAKVSSIYERIGRRPIAAFGNSDHDLPMLRWVTAGEGARFALIVHHTDAEREYAYDRGTHVGELDEGLIEARQCGWSVVDMKTDWKRIFPAKRKG